MQAPDYHLTWVKFTNPIAGSNFRLNEIVLLTGKQADAYIELKRCKKLSKTEIKNHTS